MRRAEAPHRVVAPLLAHVPGFRPGMLLEIEQAKADRVLRAVRVLKSQGLVPPRWSPARRGLEQLYRLGRRSHFFDCDHNHYVCPTEPQITRGLARLSRSPSARDDLEALAAALWPAWPGFGLTAPTARSEVDRVDLSLVAPASGGAAYGIVVEAKLEHRITARQLPRMLAIAEQKLGLVDPDRRRMIVLAPERTPALRRYLDRNPAWTFLSWRSFLLRLQCTLPDRADPGLAQFLADIWHRSNTGRWT